MAIIAILIVNHIYQRWISTYAEYIISYQRPRKLIVEYGYSVDLIEQESVRMHGEKVIS